MDNTRSAGLFAMVVAVSAAAALPLLGLTDVPWSPLGPPSPAATATPPPAAPEAPARADADPDAPAPAPRKKYRIVWAGGASGAVETRAAAARPASAMVPRMQMSTGSTVRIQPVGGYIATTASPSSGRGG